MNNSINKNWLLTSITCFVSFSVFAAVEPAAVTIGELNLYPTVDISSSYNDNFLFGENNEKSSWITRINPNFVLQGEQQNAQYQLSYGLDRGIFHSSTADNYLDHDIAAVVNLIGNSRNRVDLTASYNKGHEARGQESGGSFSTTPNPLEFDLKTLGATYTYGGLKAKGRIKLQANYSDKDFTNFRTITKTRDFSEIGAGSTFYYRMSDKASALIEVIGSKIDYDASIRDNKNTKVLTGLTWDSTGKTTGEVKVGWSDKDFDDSTLKDTDGPTWSASATWNPKSYSTFTVNLGQDFAESNGGNSFIDTDSYSINWAHFWNDRLKSTIALATLIEDFSDSRRKDTTNNFTIGLNHDTKRWLNLGISYTLEDVNSNSPLRSYQSNEVTFTLQASL